MLTQRREIKRSVHTTNASRLQEARDKIKIHAKDDDTSQTVTIAEDVLEFADTFEDYLEQIVPKQPASVNGRSSASFEASSSQKDSPTKVPGRQRSMSSSSSGSSISIFGHSSFRPIVPPVRTAAIRAYPSVDVRHDARPARLQNGSSPTALASSTQTVTSTVGRSARRVQPLNSIAPAPLRIRRPIRQETVGQHTITLTAEYLHFNNHPLSVQGRLPKTDGFEIASLFFDALLKHQDKLDALELVLGSQNSCAWFGIPGWKVHLGGVTLRPEALGIRNV